MIINNYCYSLVDTVHIKLPCDNPKLDWDSIETTKAGERSYKMYIRNMNVVWSKGILRVFGSLPKFLHHTNFYGLHTGELEELINILTDILGVNIGNSYIIRLDLAYNLSVDQPVEHYYSHFGEYKGSHRSNITESTLYYKRGKVTTLVIYDKFKEMRRNADDRKVADQYKGNLMRFEVRYNRKQLQKKIGASLTLNDLKSDSINKVLIDLWYKEYLNITKEEQSTLSVTQNMSPRQLDDLLCKIGIDSLGGANTTISLLKRDMNFKVLHPVVRSRMRKRIRSFNSVENLKKNVGLLSELNKVFEEAYIQLLN